MIEGLKKYQAVDCGDNLLVQLSQDYYTAEHKYTIAGEEVRTKLKQVLVPKGTKIYSIKNLGRELTYYQKGDVSMSTEEYKDIISKNQTQYEDSDGDVFYPDLDTEYKCKKELEKLKGFRGVYKDLGEEYSLEEIEVIASLESTGSDFIQTPLLIGKVNWPHSSGVYKVMLTAIANDEFNKLAIKYKDKAKFHNEFRSYIRFAQIDGIYVFNDKSPFTDNCATITKTLEEAKKAEEDARKLVRQIVMTKILPKQIDQVTAQSILSAVKSIQSSVLDISAKQNSQNAKSSAVKKLNELEKLLLSFSEEQ